MANDSAKLNPAETFYNKKAVALRLLFVYGTSVHNETMVENISEVFGESATLDRFHGFIPGWRIPRLNQDLIANGWAINTEYFAEVLHAMRDELSYAALVDACLDVPPKADTNSDLSR